MISNVGSTAVRNTYQDNEAKDTSKASRAIDKQGNMDKIEQLKDSIANGEYQLDLKALAKKIAQEVL